MSKLFDFDNPDLSAKRAKAQMRSIMVGMVIEKVRCSPKEALRRIKKSAAESIERETQQSIADNCP